MTVVLGTIVPVFGVVALGYLLASVRRDLHVPTLANLALLVCSPALLLSILLRQELALAAVGRLSAATVLVLLGTALLAWLYVRQLPGDRRGLLLPAIFWNSGNMGLPCARLAFGEPGLEAASVPFVIMAIGQFTIGVWIAKGRGGGGEVLRLPLVYAVALGVALAATDTALPDMLAEPVHMLGQMAIPLMLINLGVQLRHLRVTDLSHSLVAVAIRMGGGLALSWAFVALFDVTGVERQVILLGGVLPAAVANVVVAQRYDTDAAVVASTIVIGTAAALLTIPLLLLAIT